MTSPNPPAPFFRLLIVEDDRERIDIFRSWLPEGVRANVVTGAGRAIGTLQRDRGRIYGGIMLDHDLERGVLTVQEEGLCGSDVVRTMIDCIDTDVPILVHSMNPEGRAVMTKRLEAAGFDVTVIPMAQLEKDAFEQWLAEARELWEDSLEE